jgi:hypothetical protein
MRVIFKATGKVVALSLRDGKVGARVAWKDPSAFFDTNEITVLDEGRFLKLEDMVTVTIEDHREEIR